MERVAEHGSADGRVAEHGRADSTVERAAAHGPAEHGRAAEHRRADLAVERAAKHGPADGRAAESGRAKFAVDEHTLFLLERGSPWPWAKLSFESSR